MTPTHAGALQITRESLAFLRAAVAEMPEEAMDWTPVTTGNSAAVLVAHAVTATRFFLRAGSGHVRSITEYRATDRAAAFRTAGVRREALLGMIDAFATEAETIVAAGTEAQLAAVVEMPTTDNLAVPIRNGAGTLMAAIGHLREHVGHVQLMHDLWLTANRK